VDKPNNVGKVKKMRGQEIERGQQKIREVRQEVSASQEPSINDEKTQRPAVVRLVVQGPQALRSLNI
jgi:hypothetical protein